MPDYRYIAMEASGQQVEGVLAAATEQEVLRTLTGRSLFPVKVAPVEAPKSQQIQIRRRVRARHLATFFTQLADLLKSGVPLLRSLDLLQHKTAQLSLRAVIEDVRGQVADGARLADAMRRHERVFGELAVSMVRAGEEGSFLEDVLKRIAMFTEHQENLRGRVVGALVYPLFLLGMGTLIVALMVAFFVPKFQPIFDNMSSRGNLPWATTALLSLSEFLRGYGLVVLLALGAATVFFHRWRRSPEGRKWFDAFRLRAPGIGAVVRSLAVSRFCRILGTLLRNGVPILQSLQIAKDATGNVVLSEAIAKAAESVSTGKGIAQPLAASGRFPEEVIEMIAVGEESNNLEQVLIDIAENMEQTTYRQLDLFVRMLEPALLTVMAGVVLFVVSALLLPILQSSGVF